MNSKGCSKKQDTKLNTYDRLCDVPDAANATEAATANPPPQRNTRGERSGADCPAGASEIAAMMDAAKSSRSGKAAPRMVSP